MQQVNSIKIYTISEIAKNNLGWKLTLLFRHGVKLSLKKFPLESVIQLGIELYCLAKIDTTAHPKSQNYYSLILLYKLCEKSHIFD